MDHATERKPRPSRPLALFRLLCLEHSIIVALITGSAAFVAGAGGARSLGMAIAGWCLAVGGFALDFYADRDLDVEGSRARTRHIPLADGSLAPRTGLVFSLSFMALSLALTALLSPPSLLAWTLVLAILLGLALHLLETPLARAVTLGLLQALYVLMGGLAGQLSPGLLLLAGTFFFATLGGRGMIDIRDTPQDQDTRVRTLPKRYGVRRTAWFTAICLLIAYALSLAVYRTGEFGPIYLALALVFGLVGLVCAGLVVARPCLFVARPSPRLARVLTPVFTMGMGALICLAMVLGGATGQVRGRNEHRVMQDATFSALVWEDTNGNGARDEGERPVSGVVVELVSRSGQGGYGSLTTDERGRVFRLVPGVSYKRFALELVVPEGYEPTTPTRVESAKAEFGIRRTGQ